MSTKPQIEFREAHVDGYIPDDYDFVPAARGEIWKRLKELCGDNRTCRILVEGALPEMERSTADVIDAGIHTAAVPHLWLAFHMDNFEPTPQSEVFEAVAAAKGVRVKHFADREQALQWLRVNSPA